METHFGVETGAVEINGEEARRAHRFHRRGISNVARHGHAHDAVVPSHDGATSGFTQ